MQITRPEEITKLIRVVDLTKCLECNLCEKSCARRHGYHRNVRNGIKIGHFVIPYACKQCDNPPCASSCKQGAIKRNDKGILYHDKDLCMGCGLCAKKCPFNSIILQESGKFREVITKDGSLEKKPIRHVHRCDRCRGHKKNACNANCPSGAQQKYVPFNVFYFSLPPIFRKKLVQYFLNGHWIMEGQDTDGSETTKGYQVMVDAGR